MDQSIYFIDNRGDLCVVGHDRAVHRCNMEIVHPVSSDRRDGGLDGSYLDTAVKVAGLVILILLQGCATERTLCDDMTPEDCRSLIHHMERARGIER